MPKRVRDPQVMISCSHCKSVTYRTGQRHILEHWDNRVGKWLRTEFDNPLLPEVHPSIVLHQALQQASNSLLMDQVDDVFSDDESDAEPRMHYDDDEDDQEDDVFSDDESDADDESAAEQDDSAKKMLYHVLRVWQKNFLISTTAVRVLLHILYLFLNLYGIEILQQPPRSGNPFRHVLLERADILSLVACPKCATVYQGMSTDEHEKGCFYTKPSRNGRRKQTHSVRCSHVRYPHHVQEKHRQPCGTDLVYIRSQQRVVAKMEFPHADVPSQMKRLINRRDFVQQCQHWKKRNPSIEKPEHTDILSDIYEGNLWREWVPWFQESRLNLAWMLNIDWLQPYKHSMYSLGVIYLCCLNLPRGVRYLWENIIIVCCLPHTVGHVDSVPKQLVPLVESLLLLWNGVSVAGGVLKALLLMVSADLPAARATSGQTNFNADYGCSKCMKSFKGEKGADVTVRNYGRFAQDGVQNENNTKRTDRQHRQSAKRWLEAENAAAQETVAKETSTRYTPLLRLPYYDAIRHVPIDGMHCLFLGVCKHILTIFFAEGHLEGLEARLRALQSPRWIGCVVSSFDGRKKKKAKTLKRLKAGELKSFVLIYSDAILEDLLPSARMTMWRHFSTACRMMCADQVDRKEIPKIYHHVHTFLMSFEDLFGTEMCKPNLHFMHELVGCIADYGPLHAFWCFALERMNGVLGDVSTNSKNIPMTILTTITEAQESIQYTNSRFGEYPGGDMKLLSQMLTRRDDCEGDYLAGSIKHLRSEFDYATYLWYIQNIGFSELPWTNTPACLLKEKKNDHFERLSDESYALLCTKIQHIYLSSYAERSRDSVRVRPVPVSSSKRAQLFDSVLGSHGNQSWPASFVLVSYDVGAQGARELPARVESFYKIKVFHEPCLADGKAIEDGDPLEEECLFANVKWFKRHSMERAAADVPGEFEKIHTYLADSLEVHDSWVPIHQISAQFIPHYFTPDAKKGDPIPPPRLMKVCRVGLKTPC